MTYVLLACDIAVILVFVNRLLARVTWSDVSFALCFACLGILIYLPRKELLFLALGFAVGGLVLRKLRNPVERKVLRKIARIRRMKDPSKYARTILELDRMDPLDSSANEYLYPFLEDENENVRWFAIEVLTRTGNSETVDRFIALLPTDPDGPEMLIRALGDMGDRRAIPALIPYLQAPKPSARQWTIHSLVKLQADGAVDDLLKRIVAEEDRDVLCGLLRALIHFSALKKLVARWSYLEPETRRKILYHAAWLKETEYHKVSSLMTAALHGECPSTKLLGLELLFRMKLADQKETVAKMKDAEDALLRAVARKLLNDVWEEDHEVEPLRGTGQERRSGAPPDPEAFLANIPANAKAFEQSVHHLFDALLTPDAGGMERLDRLISQAWPAGKSPTTGILTVFVGAYVGEALRARQGGQWAHEGGQFVLTGAGAPASPFVAARKRLVSGPAESLAKYMARAAERG